MHGVHAAGDSSPMLSSALTLTAEALMGYWDGASSGYWTGSSSFGWSKGTDQELRRLDALEPSARINVLTHEALGLYQVEPDAEAGRIVLRIGSDPVLKLAPPDLAALERQLQFLRSASDLRSDRMAEIMAQQGDMLSFFGAQQKLSWNRKRWSMILLHALYNAVSSQEMRIKHFACVPRPIDLSPLVQPVIQTPGHSSYPSGHSTEAFAFATMIAALRHAAAPVKVGKKKPSFTKAILSHLAVAADAARPEQPIPADATVQLFRLAARIADNRTVAGVHFPVDSAHGALLGLSATLGFVAHCNGGEKALPVQDADGTGWDRDFTLALWRDALHRGEWATDHRYNVAKPAGWHSLPAVWQAAVREWVPE